MTRAPHEPIEDDDQPRKTLSVAAAEPSLIPEFPPGREQPRGESGWNEMSILRVVSTLIAVALSLAAVVAAWNALPASWAWLPFLVAFIPYGLFAASAWSSHMQAIEDEKRRASDARNAAFVRGGDGNVDPRYR